MDTDKKEKKKRILSFAGRLALILFIGLSLYLFVSTIILISLTKPEKEVIIPHVTGKRFIDVYNSLVRKGLKPEITPYDVYDMDNGIILNQYPEKGKIVYEGEKIKLVVSRTKIHLPVPNLIGMKLPFAINKLKNLHLDDKSYEIGIGIISYIPSEKIAENAIIEQSPESGEEISPDQKVNLLVSTGKIESEMKMPQLKDQAIDLCFDLLLAKGLYVAEEIIKTDSIQKSGIIETQNPKPGEPIQPGTQIKLQINYYAQKEKPYTAYERVTYTVPANEKEGLFEAYIDDNKSKRIRFSRKMKPGSKIDFVFKRKGDCRVSITNDKQVVDVIRIKPDEFN